jgi:hypothetical protein
MRRHRRRCVAWRLARFPAGIHKPASMQTGSPSAQEHSARRLGPNPAAVPLVALIRTDRECKHTTGTITMAHLTAPASAGV